MRETAITTPPRYIHLIEDDGIYIYLYEFFCLCGGVSFLHSFCYYICLFVSNRNQFRNGQETELTTSISDGSRMRHSFGRRMLTPLRLPKL
jgi:hypothetical protein